MRGVQSLSWSLLGPHGHPAQSQGHTRCSGSFYQMNHLPCSVPPFYSLSTSSVSGSVTNAQTPSFPALTPDLSFLSLPHCGPGVRAVALQPLSPVVSFSLPQILCHLAISFLMISQMVLQEKLEVLSQKFQFVMLATN